MVNEWTNRFEYNAAYNTFSGPLEFTFVNSVQPSGSVTATLLRSILGFEARSLTTWTTTPPQPGWWTDVNMAVGWFMAPSGVTPGPAYKLPLTGGSATDIPWVAWAQMELNSFYEDDVNLYQALTWRLHGGLIDTQAERKIIAGQDLWCTVQAIDDGYLGRAFGDGTSYGFGYAGYSNCLYDYTT